MRKNKQMIMALSALLILGVTGCSSKDNKTANAAEVTKAAEQETNTDSSTDAQNTDAQNTDAQNTETQNTDAQDQSTNTETPEEAKDDQPADTKVVKGVITYDSFDTIIAGLTSDQSSTLYQFDGMKNQVLVVADHAYDNQDGTMVSASCTFYVMREDGKVVEAGTAESADTAYPIAVSGSNIFVCGNHVAQKYVLKEDTQSMELVESATETFDDKGNGTYTYMGEGETEEKPVDDNTKIQAMYDEYSKATPFNFK